MRDPLSVEIDLLTGGDGDVLSFAELDRLSSTAEAIFGPAVSLSVSAEGNLDLRCLPEEQLLGCK